MVELNIINLTFLTRFIDSSALGKLINFVRKRKALEIPGALLKAKVNR